MANITSDINMANRQCCDLDIRDYKTKAPWMFADFCNTTTANVSADAVYANKKGAKRIKFDNPLEGTITMEFQVSPCINTQMMSKCYVLKLSMTTTKQYILILKQDLIPYLLLFLIRLTHKLLLVQCTGALEVQIMLLVVMMVLMFLIRTVNIHIEYRVVNML